MGNIRQKYKILLDGRSIGWAAIEQVGIRFEVSAEITDLSTEKPFRLAAQCGSNQVPLGVMLPNNGGFTYRKVYTKRTLCELGVHDVDGFTVLLDDERAHIPDPQDVKEQRSEWLPVSDIAEILEQGQFRRVFSAYKDCIIRREGEIEYLAVPIIKGEELPVVPVWYIGEGRRINKKLYMVFKIYKGKLLF